MLLNRGQLKLHLLFAVPAAIFTAGCIFLFVSECFESGEVVGGSSRSGLLCGIAAGSIIVFEMLLWPRKAFRALRLIPAKYWLAAHIWLGMASLPLAIVHSGFHLGGWLPTVFMVLFVLTIASGLYGLAVQNVLPRWMLRNLPSETIYNQIDYVSQTTLEDARQLLLTACGRRDQGSVTLDEAPELEAAKTNTVVVGAVRQAGKTRGRTLETRRVTQIPADRHALWNALDEIKPFLLEGRHRQTPVTDPRQASQWFGKLRSVCGDESDSVIDILQGMCEQRRQFDTQQTVHRWLHVWLPFHIGLSVAVTVLLAAHIWTALKYW